MKKRTPKRKIPKRKRPVLLRYELSMGVTQSILKDFLDCKERAHLEREGWEPKVRKQSFRFGTLVHDTLEFAYNGIREGKFKPTIGFKIAIDRKIETLTRLNIQKASATESIDEIEREGQIAAALLEGYFKHWEDDWKRDWVAVEGKFDVNFEGYRLRGMRDAVFLDRPKRKRERSAWLLETKTKSQINEDDLELTLTFDFQSLYYLLALELEETMSHPVRGCLYNIIRKPGLRRWKVGKTRKKEETENEFMDRIRADIEKRPDHYFKRFEIVFPDKVKEEFRNELRTQLDEFRLWLEGKRPTYRNPNACVAKYKCEFLEKCSSGGFAGYARTRTPFPELENGSEHKEAHDVPQKNRAPKRKARRREKVPVR